MTINIADNNPRVSYSVSSGVTQTSFAVPFEFFDETDVLVYIDSTLKTITTDYTVSGGDGTTGTITMSVTGPATVALVRDVTIERSTDFPTAGPFSIQSLNVELDKQIAIDADLEDQIDRAVRSPIEEFTTMTLPNAATRADKILKFDNAGNVVVESASALFSGAVVGANFTNNTFTGDGSQTAFTTTVEAGSKNNAQVYIDGVYQLKSSFSVSANTLTFTEAPPLNSQIEVIIGNAIDTVDADSGNVNYNQGGTGAQTRTVENKLQEFVSVKDFGAIGDGVTDDTAALNAAAAAISSGQTLLIPEGTYLYNPTSSPLTFASNNIEIWGKGTIKATTSVDKVVVLLSGNYITWDGPSIVGDGTAYSSYSVTTENDRWALLRVTGDDVDIRSAVIDNAYLIGIHGNGCDNLTIGNGVDVLGGPISAAVSTYAQGIRIYDCTNWRIENPHIGTSTAGGKFEEALFATDGENGFVQAIVTSAWDHGVYCISVDGLIIDGCTTITDGGGIACSPPQYQNDKVTPTKITNNNVRASATATSTVGFYVRDMHNAVIDGNFVEGFPRSYQVSPVQYNDAANNIEGINFSNNIARDWDEYGLLLAGGGLTLGKLQYIKISNFDSLPKRATQAAASTHIQSSLSAGITNSLIIDSCTLGSNGSHYPENGIFLANVDNAIVTNNIIRDVTTKGIDLNNCDYVKIISNDLSDAGTTGIDIRGACSNGNVANNNIVDGALHTLAYGIDGNDDCVGFTFSNNRILNAGTVAIRRCQYSGHTNSFFGNKTGNDPLTGTVTLAAAITTTVTNDNINTGTGYISYVRLTPINQSAATLVSGANSPFVTSGDHTAGTSFKVRQAGSAAGTEQFFYEIVQ
jgi:hypothetical protein